MILQLLTLHFSGQMCKELPEVMTTNPELHPSIGNYAFVASCNRQNYKNSGCYVKCQKGNWSKKFILSSLNQIPISWLPKLRSLQALGHEREHVVA